LPVAEVPPVLAQSAPAQPAPAEPAPAQPAKPLVVRRQTRDQEELRDELAALPELGLNDATNDLLLPGRAMNIARSHPVPLRMTPFGPLAIAAPARMVNATGLGVNGSYTHGLGAHATIDLICQMQPELADLPWRLGNDCHIGREPAENLETLSRALRGLLTAPNPRSSTPPDAELLRPLLLGEAYDNRALDVRRTLSAKRGRSPAPLPGAPDTRWVDPAAIPALLQLLTAERTPMRRLLAEVLSRIPGPAATAALVRLAVFDIAPQVRDQAILALRDRPAECYRRTLLEGLRYPWPPAADHAAEALAALDDRAAIPSLIGLLDLPDPQGPVLVSRRGQLSTVVPALVKINHLKNCLLCHDQSRSASTDLVRGRIPYPGQPLPPPVEYYAESQPDDFVRAEVTYLRQDFSVTQPVEGADPWPTQQRFDYLVVTRPVQAPLPSRRYRTEKTRVAMRGSVPAYPQRESVLFALRELTGKDAGTTSESWRDALALARP
jgi:hypothetical protein